MTNRLIQVELDLVLEIQEYIEDNIQIFLDQSIRHIIFMTIKPDVCTL